MARIKTKKPEIQISGWDQADEVLKRISVLRSQINQRVAAYNEREQEARMKEVTIPNQPLETELAELEYSLEAFACDNRADFGKLKSKELGHGILSFRTGMPKVVQMAKHTLKSSMELIKKSIWKNDLIRTKEEIDKDAIIIAYKNVNSGLTAEVLSEFGLQVKQDETFGYELKEAAERAA